MTLKIKNVDNAVEVAIRYALVDLGYQVDPSLYIGDNAAYEAAKAALPAFVEVFGMSAPKDKKIAKGPRIVVYRTATPIGDTGYLKKYFFKPIYVGDPAVLDHYEKYQLSERLYDLEYEIRFVVDSTLLDQVCSEAMAKAFNVRAYLKGLNDDLTVTQEEGGKDEGFHMMIQGDPVDLSSGDFMEKFYRYRAKNIDIQGMKLVDANIKVIDEIEFITGSEDGTDFDSVTENIS